MDMGFRLYFWPDEGASPDRKMLNGPCRKEPRIPDKRLDNGPADHVLFDRICALMTAADYFDRTPPQDNPAAEEAL
jgi:hypothetical protein